MFGGRPPRTPDGCGCLAQEARRGMEQKTVDLPEAACGLWDLSETELAILCRMLANGNIDCASNTLRAEALRLFLVWVETLNGPQDTGDDREYRAALLCGLRKRTIQILVNLKGI